ncbi:hypothetical protein B5S31_g413 [[Candida] boidinii]|nr:hypothetical protein B5S31_g413 [[Candida] boidinii]
MEDWRRIDIDKYDPDLQYEPDSNGYPDISLFEVQTKIQNIRTYISKGQFKDGLSYALSESPFGSTQQEAKTQYLISFIELLTSVRQSEITSIVKSLNSDELDLLVSLIYRGMSLKDGQKQGGVLLAWFDKTIEITGDGPIARYLSDNRLL